MPLFLCAGTPRSGSTWLYNAMRLVLVRRFPDLYAGWIGDLDPASANRSEAMLIKIHEINDSLAERADVIMTCHRDLRDVAASVQSMGWASNSSNILDHVRNCRSLHEYWAPRSKLDLIYGDIIERPQKSLMAVATALGIELEESEIAYLAKTLEGLTNNRDGDSVHDREFLTHRNHRNDGRDGRWRGQLRKGLEIAITDEHRDWLIHMGYDATIPACDDPNINRWAELVDDLS